MSIEKILEKLTIIEKKLEIFDHLKPIISNNENLCGKCVSDLLYLTRQEMKNKKQQTTNTENEVEVEDGSDENAVEKGQEPEKQVTEVNPGKQVLGANESVSETSQIYEDASSQIYGEASTSQNYEEASTSQNYGEASTSQIYEDASSSQNYGEASTSQIYGEASTSQNYEDASTSQIYEDALDVEEEEDEETSDESSDEDDEDDDEGNARHSEAMRKDLKDIVQRLANCDKKDSANTLLHVIQALNAKLYFDKMRHSHRNSGQMSAVDDIRRPGFSFQHNLSQQQLSMLGGCASTSARVIQTPPTAEEVFAIYPEYDLDEDEDDVDDDESLMEQFEFDETDEDLFNNTDVSDILRYDDDDDDDDDDGIVFLEEDDQEIDN